ncbi:Protein sym-1 [Colletotrichum sp. SAR 10_96]|nr:Protein sym-1 [Colletotrichum sp. SAR 10_96]
MLGWYQARLAARPLLTQSITTAILFATGDLTAQQLVEKRGLEKHEWARTGRMALYGGTVFGPAATTWFKFLQNNVVLRNKNLEILARVGVDQGVFAPVMIGVFLSSMAVLEGVPPQEKLEKSYTTALTSNYMLWPFVQMVNFKLVPLHHRVLSHFDRDLSKVRLIPSVLAMLAVALVVHACDYCQCKFTDGSHCCTTSTYAHSCEEVCKNAARNGDDVKCSAGGLSECIGYFTANGRAQCNSQAYDFD